MQFSFQNKIAIVTGGTRGIGKGITESLLKMDCTVHITSTGDEPIWCNNYPKLHHHKVDFTNETALDDFIGKISKLSRIDILVNNAGILIMHDIGDVDINKWETVLKVNLTAPMQLINAVVPRMKNNRSGRILNISSIAGIISKPGQSSYSATKSAILGLTRSVALDLAPYGILINSLCPGTTETDMVHSLSSSQRNIILENIPLGRLARVEEITNYAVFLCSEYNTYMTGQTLIVDGGFTIK